MTLQRREFLKRATLTVAGTSLVPTFLQACNTTASRPMDPSKKLVIIQLTGGNDGLNTIIPYRNDIYYASRPVIGVKQSDVLKVSDDLGFNNQMESLRSVYDNGDMAILNGVGYPNPNRSHFRSMDIWQSARPDQQNAQDGWIGRLLDNSSGMDFGHAALEIDDTLSLALKGDDRFGMAVRNVDQLYRTASRNIIADVADFPTGNGSNSARRYLYKTMQSTLSSVSYLHDLGNLRASSGDYPGHEFGKNLQMISNLIRNGCNTRIYYTSLSGFDTHNQQPGRQGRLLEIYSKSVAALVEDLKKDGMLDNTLILTFSEFGRRVQENASRGTDHGTANNIMMYGGKVKPGFLNKPTDLSVLENGDLVYETDFRSVYATILENWLEMDSLPVLGQKFKTLSFV